jgi:hypothetical protein
MRRSAPVSFEMVLKNDNNMILQIIPPCYPREGRVDSGYREMCALFSMIAKIIIRKIHFEPAL